jgi:hypothetical protein
LLVHYFFHGVINNLNTWYLDVKESGLPVEFTLEKLIKDKLRYPLKEFIQYANAGVKWHCIKPVDWQRLYVNQVWDLDTSDLYAINENFKVRGRNRIKKIIALRDSILSLLPSFMNVILAVSNSASLSLDQSILPLKKELQEKHTPHLAILFAFLNLFKYLQQDLNSFSKKHLDFFYKQVLQVKAGEGKPDKAHILIEIQNQLNNYKLGKGLQVKDGKDNQKADVFFALDQEIVVNKTSLAEKRTLFLNNRTIGDNTFVEGVYMAPDAVKADGMEEDFKEGAPKSFSTLGAKFSKYNDPEHNFIKPYPNARLGLILASPVLLLNEGRRTITINLACELKKDICSEIKIPAGSPADPCCEGNAQNGSGDAFIKYPDFFNAGSLYDEVATALNKTWYYISKELISQASMKGVGKALTDKLSDFITEKKKICYCEKDEKKFETIVPAKGSAGNPGFEDLFNEAERELLSEFFKPRKALNIMFSGENEWIEPDPPSEITIAPAALPGSNKFVLTIESLVEDDKPAITFYDKEKLKEDFNTTQPLVKIELDDKIKLWPEISLPPDDCCLEKEPEKTPDVSMYHFFRNVILIDKTAVNPGEEPIETGIAVTVCELKNFIVQNDESVQDVNSPVYPFGTRPAIIDFDVVNPADPPLANPNLVGPNFYIGSKEVFCKKWQSVRININWKDKPTDFREYYKAYLVEDVAAQIFGLDEDNFKIRLSLLQNKNWEAEAANRKLFDVSPPAALPPFFPGGETCDYGDKYEQSLVLDSGDFPNAEFCIDHDELKPFNVNSRNGFVRINLREQDFLHKDYAFVLARQMMALGRYPDAILEGAVYKKEGDTVIVFRSLGKTIVDLKDEIFTTKDLFDLVKNKIDELNITFDTAIDFPPPLSPVTNAERNTLIPLVHDSKTLSDNAHQQADDTKTKLADLQEIIDIFDIFTGEIVKPLTVLIPNEPWTPIIKEISLDYTASASISDIDLIHLYPYKGTYKPEEITSRPTLLPTFCDEGTLFLGLDKLVPGSVVNMLFQLAEATADSESEREKIHWNYLDNNQWKMLRTGFEVLEDATNGLTTSGIIKFSLPANMNSNNTILPKGLHWIKAAIPANSRSVSETTGIHTQAVQVTFTNEETNDKLRLANPLPAGSIAKLKEADASVKKVSQPYEGFGGSVPETEGHFYVRVSEHLRHKGRAIQKFDYERLALEAFPQLFKVKCINHSFALDAHKYFNDFPVAPGYVLLAVIADLNRLKASESFEPRVPASLLEDIRDYLRTRTSPFVRLRVMNPRYEQVHFCLKVKLLQGRDENYHKEKLAQDLREFLAPWAVGIYDKLSFGQCIYRSDIIRFLETRDYLDYILDMRMEHEYEPGPPVDKQRVCPATPRSILIAGDIDICIQQQDCEKWEKCYDDNQQEKECCENEKIPFTGHCRDKEID